MSEEKIGIVIKFFHKPMVAAIKLTDGGLRVGDTIKIKGHTTDFEQKIESMQVNNAPVQDAPQGSDIGIKVGEKVRDHDLVFLVK